MRSLLQRSLSVLRKSARSRRSRGSNSERKGLSSGESTGSVCGRGRRSREINEQLGNKRLLVTRAEEGTEDHLRQLAGVLLRR